MRRQTRDVKAHIERGRVPCVGAAKPDHICKRNSHGQTEPVSLFCPAIVKYFVPKHLVQQGNRPPRQSLFASYSSRYKGQTRLAVRLSLWQPVFQALHREREYISLALSVYNDGRDVLRVHLIQTSVDVRAMLARGTNENTACCCAGVDQSATYDRAYYAPREMGE